MFDLKSIDTAKKKYQEEQKKRIKKSKSLKQLRGYLNPFEYKEFMPLYIPKDKDEAYFVIKPLPYINKRKSNISAVSLPFSKHLSKDNKYNCSLNISDNCEICNKGLIKRYDFTIFPAFIIKNSNSEHFKDQIFLIELETYLWEDEIFPYLEDIYNGDTIITIKIKNRSFYKYIINREEYEIPYLTKEEILNKSFVEDTIKKYLYNEKAYEKRYKINVKKEDILIIEE